MFLSLNLDSVLSPEHQERHREATYPTPHTSGMTSVKRITIDKLVREYHYHSEV